MRLLAWLHPLWMLGSITLAGLALREGLLLRRARLGGRPRVPGARARHVRVAKLAVAAVILGFVAGPISMIWLRGRAPFETVHALLGCLAATCFAVTAFLGRRLERGAGQRAPHGALGLLAFLLAAAAAVAGFVLLP